jgi:uncharacterized protein
MGERTKYSPGAFSWAELATTDQDAAKQFYGQLFGWSAVDNPIGDGVVYSVMQVGGKDVAAISPQMQSQREAGAPPAWNSYITVQSADATADKAKGLGGNVLAPPFDVMDLGRMAVIQDPQGAVFMVWEPKTNIGAQLVNAPGALAWNELATPDLDASAEFYRELLGWQTEPVEGMESPYLMVKTADGATNGGMRPAAETEPPYWLIYFGTEDAEAALSKATELGGTAVMGPMDIGMGKIGVVQDPQGTVVAVFAGRFED